ncbi:unnamed protein product [Acanthoscelides obtectus]|uniref:Uncharacterized protein n=1 Tax=Acanthoscelides obtectus TaxID=200917 RepID=A0A9P0K414_ACAOB|nr:unnamed protein product [Acanthoscelides obtectus]CAK1629051.1 hypothetical protein AOBTE_LOCUS5553 [Acanthoscelides obtectus]
MKKTFSKMTFKFAATRSFFGKLESEMTVSSAVDFQKTYVEKCCKYDTAGIGSRVHFVFVVLEMASCV